MVDGPRTDLDLCDYPGSSSFDPVFGDWRFTSKDADLWPSGVYYLLITGTLGDLSDSYELEFILIDPCSEAEWTMLSQPFKDYVYEINSPAIVQTWSDSDIYSVKVEGKDPSLCGIVIVEFVDFDEQWYFA